MIFYHFSEMMKTASAVNPLLDYVEARRTRRNDKIC
jgi:hypothetical protein